MANNQAGHRVFSGGSFLAYEYIMMFFRTHDYANAPSCVLVRAIQHQSAIGEVETSLTMSQS